MPIYNADSLKLCFASGKSSANKAHFEIDVSALSLILIANSRQHREGYSLVSKSLLKVTLQGHWCLDPLCWTTFGGKIGNHVLKCT